MESGKKHETAVNFNLFAGDIPRTMRTDPVAHESAREKKNRSTAVPDPNSPHNGENNVSPLRQAKKKAHCPRLASGISRRIH